MFRLIVIAAALLSAFPACARTSLSADTTFYVGTTGSDANDGLSTSTPFATIQHAVDVVYGQTDLGNYNARIQVGCGSNWGPVLVRGRHVGAGEITLAGDSSCRPVLSRSAIMPVTFATSPTYSVLYLTNGATLNIENLDFTSTQGQCILVVGAGTYLTVRNVGVAPCDQSGMEIDDLASLRVMPGLFQIKGGTNTDFLHVSGGYVGWWTGIGQSQVIGNPTFPAGFLQMALGGVFGMHHCVFTGTASGRRFLLKGGGTYVMDYDNNKNCFPGDSEGVTIEGGVYGDIIYSTNLSRLSYTPTILELHGGFLTGGIATYGLYRAIEGREINFNAAVTVNPGHLGTATTGFRVSLPNGDRVRADTTFQCEDKSAPGVKVTCIAYGGDSWVYVYAPLAEHTYVISGAYERL